MLKVLLRPKSWRSTKAEPEFVPPLSMQLDNMHISSMTTYKCSLENKSHENFLSPQSLVSYYLCTLKEVLFKLISRLYIPTIIQKYTEASLKAMTGCATPAEIIKAKRDKHLQFYQAPLRWPTNVTTSMCSYFQL